MVAISILVTRYQPHVESMGYGGQEAKLERTYNWLDSFAVEEEMRPNTLLFSASVEQPKTHGRKQNKKKNPTNTTGSNASFAVFLLVVSLTSLAFIITIVIDALLSADEWTILCGGISGLFIVASLMFLTRQPRNSATFPIMVPCFPGIPVVAIFVNILLMTELNYWSFVRFGAWLVPGKTSFFCFCFCLFVVCCCRRCFHYNISVDERTNRVKY